MTPSELRKAAAAELARRDYTKKTVEIYTKYINDLCKFFPDIPPDNMTLDDIRAFIEHLISRKKYSAGTIKAIFNAIVFAFREVLHKEFDFDSVARPYQERKIPGLLSQAEVRKLIESTPNTKHRTLFELIYSCGMDLGEAVRLRVSDLDLKRGKIKIRSARKRKTREAVLSRLLVQDLKSYLNEFHPGPWLYPGASGTVHIGGRTIQRVLEQALSRAGIEKNISVKSLKYCYVKHLQEQGVPLVAIINNLGLNPTYSLIFFSKMTQSKDVAVHNPLDRIMRTEDDVQVDLSSLERMLHRVQDEDERDYLLEALQAMKAPSIRPGVIFAWSAAIHNIRKRCSSHSFNTINLHLKRHNPNAPEMRQADDLARIPDNLLLLLASDLAIFEKNEKDMLENCLDLRNKCGHPGKYRPGILKAAAFLEDLVTIVFR